MFQDELAFVRCLWSLGFVGLCGLHRLYLSQFCFGFVCMLSCGLCSMGQLADGTQLEHLVEQQHYKYRHSNYYGIEIV
jgi:TM2 domain-containing membrane protein YozV